MRYSELKKILKRNGCRLLKEGSNHEIWYSENTGKMFTVPRHNSQEVKTGTLKAIKRDAGIE